MSTQRFVTYSSKPMCQHDCTIVIHDRVVQCIIRTCKYTINHCHIHMIIMYHIYMFSCLLSYISHILITTLYVHQCVHVHCRTNVVTVCDRILSYTVQFDYDILSESDIILSICVVVVSLHAVENRIRRFMHPLCTQRHPTIVACRPGDNTYRTHCTTTILFTLP